MKIVSIKENKNYNAFSVEREYVNSKAFHDKFEQLPINRNVQQALRRPESNRCSR